MSDIKIGKWRVLVPHTMKETARCAVCDLSGIVGAYLPYPLAVSDETLAQRLLDARRRASEKVLAKNEEIEKKFN